MADDAQSNYEFKGSILGFFVLKYLHFACKGILAVTVGGAGIRIVSGILPLDELPVDIGAAAEWVRDFVSPYIPGTLVLVAFLAQIILNERVRAYRVRHTYAYGRKLGYKRGLLAVFHRAANWFLAAASFGVAGPIVQARNTRHRWRHTYFEDDPGARLDHSAPVADLYLVWIVWLLGLPVIAITLGLAFFPLRYLTIKWEQSNILVPKAGGGFAQARFTGSIKEYVKIAVKGWLISLATVGLYSPRSTLKVWEWISDNTELE